MNAPTQNEVYTRPAVGTETGTGTSGVNRGQSEGATATSGNSPKTSGSKDSEFSKTKQEKTEISSENQPTKAESAAETKAEAAKRRTAMQQKALDGTETEEDYNNYVKEIPQMSDEELLAAIGREGFDVDKAQHVDLYDEYDSRHSDEYTSSYEMYADAVKDSSRDEVEDMLAKAEKDLRDGGFATDERTRLLAQIDALADRLQELDNRVEESNEPEQETAPSVQEQKQPSGSKVRVTGYFLWVEVALSQYSEYSEHEERDIVDASQVCPKDFNL